MDSETLPIWFTCRAAWCARAVKAAAVVVVMLLLGASAGATAAIETLERLLFPLLFLHGRALQF